MTQLTTFLSATAGLVAALATGTAASAYALDGSMTFRMGMTRQGVPVVYAQGDITSDTPTDFLSFLMQNAPAPGTRVILNSDGGALSGGLALGRMIRAHGLDTAIGAEDAGPDPFALGAGSESPLGTVLTAQEEYGPGGCYSSCAMAFLGGNAREVRLRSEYGVHQASIACGAEAGFGGTLPQEHPCRNPELSYSEAQYSSGAILEYILEMGVDPRLFLDIVWTPPEAMTVLPGDWLAAYGIVRASAAVPPSDPWYYGVLSSGDAAALISSIEADLWMGMGYVIGFSLELELACPFLAPEYVRDMATLEAESERDEPSEGRLGSGRQDARLLLEAAGSCTSEPVAHAQAAIEDLIASLLAG